MRALFAFVLIFSLCGGDLVASPLQPPAQKKKTRKYVPKKKRKTVVKVVAKPIDPLNQPVVGTWYLLDSERKFVKMTKIVLSKYGEFVFSGSAWKSTGTFRFRDSAVTLNWQSVDGQPVKYGTMKKVLPVFESAKLIQLDRFQYGKFN